jgi:hypothetical protein
METTEDWKLEYMLLREVPGIGLCGIKPMMFTYSLVVRLDEMGYQWRYCYEYAADAVAAIKQWDGKDHPPGPWIKLKGLGMPELLGPGAGDGHV